MMERGLAMVKHSHIQTCSRYAQPPRLAFQPVLEQPSHSARYNQASAAEPQLYVPMTSHSKRSGRTNQDMVFPLPSAKRKLQPYAIDMTERT
jgi:hypothetical protein